MPVQLILIPEIPFAGSEFSNLLPRRPHRAGPQPLLRIQTQGVQLEQGGSILTYQRRQLL